MMRYRSFGEGGRVLLSVIGLGGSGYGRIIYGEFDELRGSENRPQVNQK